MVADDLGQVRVRDPRFEKAIPQVPVSRIVIAPAQRVVAEGLEAGMVQRGGLGDPAQGRESAANANLALAIQRAEKRVPVDPLHPPLPGQAEKTRKMRWSVLVVVVQVADPASARDPEAEVGCLGPDDAPGAPEIVGVASARPEIVEEDPAVGNSPQQARLPL